MNRSSTSHAHVANFLDVFISSLNKTFKSSILLAMKNILNLVSNFLSFPSRNIYSNVVLMQSTVTPIYFVTSFSLLLHFDLWQMVKSNKILFSKKIGHRPGS